MRRRTAISLAFVITSVGVIALAVPRFQAARARREALAVLSEPGYLDLGEAENPRVWKAREALERLDLSGGWTPFVVWSVGDDVDRRIFILASDGVRSPRMLRVEVISRSGDRVRAAETLPLPRRPSDPEDVRAIAEWVTSRQ